MDQRTRTRLPVLPTLVRAAETERRATRGRLQAALSLAPHEVFTAYGSTLMRRPAQAGRVYVTEVPRVCWRLGFLHSGVSART
jgi:hypothetical protein